MPPTISWTSKKLASGSLCSQSETFVRLPKRRPEPELLDDDLQFGEDVGGVERSSKAESASEQVAVSLAFPGNDFNVRDARAIGRGESLADILVIRDRS